MFHILRIFWEYLVKTFDITRCRYYCLESPYLYFSIRKRAATSTAITGWNLSSYFMSSRRLFECFSFTLSISLACFRSFIFLVYRGNVLSQNSWAFMAWICMSPSHQSLFIFGSVGSPYHSCAIIASKSPFGILYFFSTASVIPFHLIDRITLHLTDSLSGKLLTGIFFRDISLNIRDVLVVFYIFQSIFG